MRACEIESEDPLGVNSAKLVEKDACLDHVNTYSIRVHLSERPHFDFAIGNPGDATCIDFIIPHANATVKTTKKPRMPDERKRRLIFMNIHPIEVLNAKIGDVHTIKKGEYGAGTWWVIERGSARISRSESGNLDLTIGKDRYHVIKARFSGGNEGYLIWRA